MPLLQVSPGRADPERKRSAHRYRQSASGPNEHVRIATKGSSAFYVALSTQQLPKALLILVQSSRTIGGSAGSRTHTVSEGIGDNFLVNDCMGVGEVYPWIEFPLHLSEENKKQ